MSQPLLSICIPTNGIPELVFPVLDSIFSQKDVDKSLFEVVVMDNGHNEEFQHKITEYINRYKNLIYRQTDAYEFLSEAECYKAASGLFIKFVNHRTKLLPNTIAYLLKFIDNNIADKPSVYFANGVIKGIDKVVEYDSFDGYVRGLSYWSSWSTGMGFWKEDFERIPEDTKFNTLFPHTTILFNEKHKKRYIIDNTILLDEILVSHANKGKYNLFYAFGVEYPGIISDLYRIGAISCETFLKVKEDNFGFIAGLYYNFVFKKEKCSYDLSQKEDTLNVFYSYKKVKHQILPLLLRGIGGKILRILRIKK